MSDQQSYDPKLTNHELHLSISALGVKKANSKAWQLLLLAMLAGLYISIGGHLYLVAIAGGGSRILGGAVFSVGLMLVVIAGAELFTGNILMIVGSILSLYRFRLLLKNWVVVYIGNFVGSMLFAWGVFGAGLFGSVAEPNALGELAISVAQAKLALTFGEAFLRGLFCNMLVILAVLLSIMARDMVSKMLACLFPIMTFVAVGFEHSIANMFLIPIGLFASGAAPAAYAGMFSNILPVTLGNIVGGVVILMIHPNRLRQLGMLLSRRREARAAQVGQNGGVPAR